MKWAAMIVLVLTAGTVGAFAIYTFGWRDDDDPAADRARAELAASSAARVTCGTPCDATDLRHRGGSVWEFRAEGGCYLVDIERFEIFSNGVSNEGAARCPAD